MYVVGQEFAVFQVPAFEVTVVPTVAEPLIAGATVLDGGTSPPLGEGGDAKYVEAFALYSACTSLIDSAEL